MTIIGNDSLNTQRTLTASNKEYTYFSLPAAYEEIGDLERLPHSLKVLLENLIRHEDGDTVTLDDIKAFAGWLDNKTADKEIAYRPARVLMQDFTGVPAVVDLAAMRDAMAELGGGPEKINPLSPVDLIIDHSVSVDFFGSDSAFRDNVKKEMERNRERYEFLRWGQEAFDNFRVVPPGTGICHQVNLEYLGKTVFSREINGTLYAYPDTLVGTDSHTTMINALAILGWGVGGIEAEAAMLGQPISMLIPDVVGFKLTGSLSEGTTATDLVLTVTEMLRKKGVVGKFVEFYGDGLESLSLADRATISNMSPEYGATCGFFPIDKETLRYLELTGRDDDTLALVEEYAKAQGLWHDASSPDPVFSDTLELDIGNVEPSLAGPKRPQDRIALSKAVDSFDQCLTDTFDKGDDKDREIEVDGKDYTLGHGDVVVAAITSCTNTSNPSVMIASGLIAKRARELGMRVKPWVKTSLAPGSQVVTEYLEQAGLQDDLDALGFNLVGYGCTTCIGNSGPLPDHILKAVNEGDLVTCSVLSGNRNFEGRINTAVKANYLASPPLVVVYALAGSMNIDVFDDPIAQDKDGNDVYLKDIWPSNEEIRDVVESKINKEMFRERYSDVFTGTPEWREIEVTESLTYDWRDDSTYVRRPPYFEGMSTKAPETRNIEGARILALLGDSITTDHISPAGAFSKDTPAGKYLIEKGVEPADFNSYGSRRGNHEVMMRGTFANVRLKNEMAPDKEGGFTSYIPDGEEMTIFEAAMKYREDGTPLVVIAGKEYGTGSSRDWAAKGTILLGVKAVLAESYERIHRSNLIGMGVLPLQFKSDDDRKSLGLSGKETIDIKSLEGGIEPGQDVAVTITYEDGSKKEITALCRIDTANEVRYYQNAGILHYVLRRLADEE